MISPSYSRHPSQYRLACNYMVGTNIAPTDVESVFMIELVYIQTIKRHLDKKMVFPSRSGYVTKGRLL